MTPEPTQEPSPTTAPTPAPPRRRWLRWTVAALLLLALLTAGAAVGGWEYLSWWGERPYGSAAERSVTIVAGTSARAIARRMHELGLVSRPELYLLWLKREGKLASLHAGRYRLRGPISPRELTEQLRRGSFQRKLTIPEGWTARRIGERLASEDWITTGALWLSVLEQPGELPRAFIDATGIEPTSGTLAAAGGAPLLEGFLFPDTYLIEAGSPPRAILQAMLEEFARQWRAADPARRGAPAQDLTPRQIVTLASMIQREARSAGEMPLIASVYYNRLARRMKLQCDATVHYALGDVWERKLTYADLEVDSPYNTYRHEGLPPGPIANPGRAALEAALRPAETDYLYYVYAGGDQHIFSATWREHQRAVRAARRRE